jgi:dihydroneopterin aldolase
MITVHLRNTIFQAQHGLYEGELETGNTFRVDLDVQYPIQKMDLSKIRNLISYEDLFKLVKKRMSHPTPLLEELADGIIRKIKHEFHQTRYIRISIYKLSAPIQGLQGEVGVTLERSFKD